MSARELCELLTEKHIDDALEQSWFTVVYQPQVSLAKQETIYSFEAFVRMQHPRCGLMGPQTIFPLIYRMEKLLELTQRVIECIAKDWSIIKADGQNIKVAVNIECELLKDSRFANMLEETLLNYHVPSSMITLE
jgi:EAL domain-containing protein (putative c-di-GMP-specific phosphodiesterase class I)